MHSSCRSPRHATTSLWVVPIVAILCLGGCTLRLDGPADALPDLTPGQSGISAVTRDEKAISAGADAIANDVSQSKALRGHAGEVRDQAEQRLAAMGGIWNPWPEGMPRDAQPGPAPVPVPGSLNDLLQLLVDSAATACRASSAAPAANEATLLAATCAANRIDANALASIAGIQPPAPSVEDTSKSTPTNPETPQKKIEDRVILEKLEKAQASLDFARYCMETAAAFLSGDDKSWALRRTQNLTWEVQALIELGADDQRSGQYALDFFTVKDTTSAIRLLNRADADALATELSIIAALPPAGKDYPERRKPWIDAVKASAFSQSRFGIPSSQIFSQLWP